jgi:hypothetical protein
VVQHAAKAQDPYFHEVLYNTLVDLRAVPQLLQLDSPHLERHLRSVGGLPPKGPLPAGTSIGPLSPTQVPTHPISCPSLDSSDSTPSSVINHVSSFCAIFMLQCQRAMKTLKKLRHCALTAEPVKKMFAQE